MLLAPLQHAAAFVPSLLMADVQPRSLAHLDGVDILVIGIYFAIVIFIGFYLKGSSNTSEDFFLAGREMTAWIAGLSFVSANLGSLELMGWAGSAYQYGILATHWYWIGAIPAMLFPRHRDDAFLLHLEDAFSARLSAPALRRRRACCLSHQFRLHDHPDERHQHVLDGAGDEGCAGLEPELQHLGFVDHGRCLCRARRLEVCDLQRGAAVRPDLGRRGAGADPWSGRSRRL